ncbi:MAG: hypothetical protein PHI94_07015 [Eubacteriaceae bacterium]|jgi:hypothetical protein|nr:hypothetical protein [Eubacteriaceae bacterium]MDD4507633.1 hypothetical protein [Eubacteriaceae bacterium]
MFKNITKDGSDTLISDGKFQVRITPKIYGGGFTLTKIVEDQPLEIIEIRDIRLPLSEKEILKEAKTLLKQCYDSVDVSHYNIQTV